MKLEGRVAIVTGSSMGIGQGIAAEDSAYTSGTLLTSDGGWVAYGAW